MIFPPLIPMSVQIVKLKREEIFDRMIEERKDGLEWIDRFARRRRDPNRP